MSSFAGALEGLRTVALVAGIGLVALPAVAGEIYSWRTEDGGYAFTDDPKAVPARYQGRVETRQTRGLDGYARLTEPPAGAGEAYAERLSERLERLRALNRDLDAAAARPAVPAGGFFSVDAGGYQVGVPTGASPDPIVVEKVRFRHDKEMATRHNIVVRQGDRLLTVIRGNPNAGPVDQAPDLREVVD